MHELSCAAVVALLEMAVVWGIGQWLLGAILSVLGFLFVLIAIVAAVSCVVYIIYRIVKMVRGKKAKREYAENNFAQTDDTIFKDDVNTFDETEQIKYETQNTTQEKVDYDNAQIDKKEMIFCTHCGKNIK